MAGKKTKVAELPDGPPDATGLTPRQQRVLTVIKDSIERRGYPPSMREIGEAVGLTSSSSVAHQLRVLEEKGFLKRDPNRPRALEVFLPEVMAARRSMSSPDETSYDETGIGDANPVADPWTFRLGGQKQARVRLGVPYVGYALSALGRRDVRMVAIALPALLIAGFSMLRLWRQLGAEARRRAVEAGTSLDEADEQIDEARTLRETLALVLFGEAGRQGEVAGEVPPVREARRVTLLLVEVAAEHRRPPGAKRELALTGRVLH